MTKTRTARRVGRKRAALLGVLAVVGAAAAGFALAAPNKPDFALAMSPTAQSVPVGSSVTSGSTSGLSFSFNPASPVSGSTTVLTVTASPSAAVGNRSLTLAGTGGGKTRTAPFSVNVQPAAQPGFNFTVTPSSRTLSQNDSTSYAVAIARLNGFAGNVTLSVAGLPKKTSGTFSPATISGPSGTSSTLTIVSEHNAEIGTFTLTVTGSGGSPVVTRTASVTLQIAKKHDFSISGNAGSILYPGKTSDVNLTLTNPNSFVIRVTALGVSVEEQTTNAACSGTQNFTTSALVGTIDVPGNTTATLSQLGVSAPRLPKITFMNKPVNQDACKNVTVTLQYGGTAVKP
jgi:hypothetical protein